MRRQLLAALRMLLVLSVLTGLAYPLAITGVAQTFFEAKANGSLVLRDGTVVGSRWIGQSFSEARYFHPRPSLAGGGYDSRASGASNKGPTNPDLLAQIGARVTAYRTENRLGPEVAVPVDAVTASASGLDPHISVENARLQAPRVADSRKIQLAVVLKLIDENTDGRGAGFLGEAGVNVLELNLALDRIRGA